MRWLPRVAVAFTLSAFAVAALTWVGWPRPRSVARLDGLGAVNFAHPLPGTVSRYRLIQQGKYGSCNAGFWFLSPDGRLRGPWRVGRPMLPLGFDAADRLLACSLHGREGDRGFTLARYDPETGDAEIVLAVDGPGPVDVKLSRDFSTLALVSIDPLAIDLYDLADGRKRARLTFPDRFGGLSSWPEKLSKQAAHAWEVSPDGQQLLLAEAWDGNKRLTPQGLDVYEVATGRLARRLVHCGDPVPAALPGESLEFGVESIEFTGDGRSVSYSLYSPYVQTGPQQWGTSMPTDVHHCDYATGDFRPAADSANDSGGHFYGRRAAAHGDQSFWYHMYNTMGGFEGGPSAYRVTDASGGVVQNWQQLPGEFANSPQSVTPQPDRPAVIFHLHRERPRPIDSKLFWLARRLMRPEVVPNSTYLYLDWSAGEFRHFGGSVAGPQTHAVGPHDLAILTQDIAGGTLTVWDLPPPRPPWRWSVPAGVALGVLLTAAGVRLRRRGASRPARVPPRPPPT